MAIAALLPAAGCGTTTIVTGAVTPTPTPIPTPTPTPTPTPSPFPTPTPTPSPAAASRFVFGTPGFESGSVQAGAIRNGIVSPVAGSPFGEGMGTPSIIEITTDPQQRFVYVLNVGAQAAGELIGHPGICGFKINQNAGTLDRVPGSPIIFTAFTNGNFIVVDGAGRFLFEPNGQGSGPGTSFDVYSIDQNSGALRKTLAGSNAPPVGAFSAASSEGRFLFNAGNGLVEVFSIAPRTGQLTAVAGTPISASGSGGPMAITRDGKFLYVANQTEGTVSVFAISAAGNLAPVAGAPFPIDTLAEDIVLSPDGKFLYVAAFPGAVSTVKGYAVSPSAGMFAPISGAAVSNASSVTLDQSGKFAYITQNLDGLTTYSIDSATGALTRVSHAAGPFSDDANDVITTR
jgi:6-phosphogluconolactonase (cycloisomerase 2 family)